MSTDSDRKLRSGGSHIKKTILKTGWASSQFFSHSWGVAKILRDEGEQFYFTQPVVILDATPKAWDAMTKRAAKELYESSPSICHCPWDVAHASTKRNFISLATRVLKSIGLKTIP